MVAFFLLLSCTAATDKQRALVFIYLFITFSTKHNHHPADDGKADQTDGPSSTGTREEGPPTKSVFYSTVNGVAGKNGKSRALFFVLFALS